MKTFAPQEIDARAWLRGVAARNLPWLRKEGFTVREGPAARVTIVAYWFSDDDDTFGEIEFSIRHTQRMIGTVPVAVVANRRSPIIGKLADSYPGDFRLHVEHSLVPDDISSMSLDCIRNLYLRFNTDFCLIVQNDGFPLREGIEEFLDSGYDYIGAPVPWMAVAKDPQYLLLKRVLNGGFSLRSRRYCKAVSEAFGELSHITIPGEDRFYTQTARRLPSLREFRIPGAKYASRFSLIDCRGLVDISPKQGGPMESPFGVHGATALWQRRNDLQQCGYAIG